MKATGSQYLSFRIGSRSFFSAKMTIVIRKHQMILSITRQDIYIYELPNHEWKEGSNTSTTWRQGEQGEW